MWRRAAWALGLSAIVLTSAACKCGNPASGCRFRTTTYEVVRNLSDERAKVRRGAATALRTNRGIPDYAIEPLIEALMREDDKDAHGEILVTLGHSGDWRALEHILMTLQINDSHAQRYGADALWAWRVARGLERETERPQSFQSATTR